MQVLGRSTASTRMEVLSQRRGAASAGAQQEPSHSSEWGAAQHWQGPLADAPRVPKLCSAQLMQSPQRIGRTGWPCPSPAQVCWKDRLAVPGRDVVLQHQPGLPPCFLPLTSSSLPVALYAAAMRLKNGSASEWSCRMDMQQQGGCLCACTSQVNMRLVCA